VDKLLKRLLLILAKTIVFGLSYSVAWVWRFGVALESWSASLTLDRIALVHTYHYRTQLLCRVPRALGKGHKALGKAFAKCDTRHTSHGKILDGKSCADDCEKTARWLEIMQNWALEWINEFSYPSSHELVEAKVALMVWCTWHHQTPLLASVVRLLPLGPAPPVHHLLPALGMTIAPQRRHLHIIKYVTYKKIKLSILSLRRNLYWCSLFTCKYCSRVSRVFLAWVLLIFTRRTCALYVWV
jgi:hypothetical protein